MRLGLLPPPRAGRRPPPEAVRLLRSDWCTGSVRKGHIQTKSEGRKFSHLASFASESWSGCASPSSRLGALSPVSSPSSLGSSSSGSGSTSSGISKRLMRLLRVGGKKVKCFTASIYLIINLFFLRNQRRLWRLHLGLATWISGWAILLRRDRWSYCVWRILMAMSLTASCFGSSKPKPRSPKMKPLNLRLKVRTKLKSSRMDDRIKVLGFGSKNLATGIQPTELTQKTPSALVFILTCCSLIFLANSCDTAASEVILFLYAFTPLLKKTHHSRL